MPFKSKKQKEKFAQMVAEGKISAETFNEWEAATPKKLPERVGKKPSGKITSLKQLREFAKKK